MDNLTELKTIWQAANTDNLPDAMQMRLVIKSFRTRRLRKKWSVISSAVLLTILMTVILFTANFKFITTYAGGLLIAASGIFLALNNLRSLKRFDQLEDCNNTEFVNFIEQTRLNQIYYYKKTQVTLMMLCSIGLLLYLYEQAVRSLHWTLAVFVVTLACLLFCWLVVRPRIFKSNQEKLKELRSRIENISNQFK